MTTRSDKWRGIVKMRCETCGGTGDYCVPDGHIDAVTECPACNGTGYRMPTDAEIEAWLAVNVMGWHEGVYSPCGSPNPMFDYHGWLLPDGTPALDFGMDIDGDWHPLSDANQSLMLAPENLILDKEGDEWMVAPQYPAPPGCGAVGTFTEALCLARALGAVAEAAAKQEAPK